MRRPNEVPTEEIELLGFLEAADQISRRWAMRDAHGTLWRGVIEDDDLGLDELVIAAEYRFTCSRQKLEPGTRGRRPLLRLLAISEP